MINCRILTSDELKRQLKIQYKKSKLSAYLVDKDNKFIQKDNLIARKLYKFVKNAYQI